MTNRTIRFILALLLAYVFATVHVASVYAQVATTVQENGGTTIRIGDLLSPWAQMIGLGLASVVTAALGFLAALLQKWTGQNFDWIKTQQFQTAVENAAGKVLVLVGDKIGNVQFDVRSQYIRDAILYVSKSAPEAISHFFPNLTGEQLNNAIGEKIMAKIGVLTASNQSASPTAVIPNSPAPMTQDATPTKV